MKQFAMHFHLMNGGSPLCIVVMAKPNYAEGGLLCYRCISRLELRVHHLFKFQVRNVIRTITIRLLQLRELDANRMKR